jgi:hypothetical protein
LNGHCVWIKLLCPILDTGRGRAVASPGIVDSDTI